MCQISSRTNLFFYQFLFGRITLQLLRTIVSHSPGGYDLGKLQTLTCAQGKRC